MKIRRKEIGCGRMFPGVVAVDLKISCPWFLELWRKQFQGFWNYKVKIIMELLGVSVLKTLFFYYHLSIMETIYLLQYYEGQISYDPNWTSQNDHLRSLFDHLRIVIRTLHFSPIVTTASILLWHCCSCVCI